MPTRRDTRHCRPVRLTTWTLLSLLTGVLTTGCDKIQIPEVVQQAQPAPQPSAAASPPPGNAPVQPAPATTPMPAAPVDHKTVVAAFVKKSKTQNLTDRDLIEVTEGGAPGDFDEVKELRLAGAEITDAGAARLSKFSKLTTLEMGTTGVTNVGIEVVKDLPELTSLGLSHTRADDRIMSTIASNPSIKELRLAQTPITDFGLNELEKLKNLESLDINHTSINGSGFEGFRGHKNLKTLIAHHSAIQNESLKFLVNCPIEVLELDQSGISDPGMVFIGRMKKLKKLSISFSSIGDAGVHKLGVMKDLEYVNVRNDPGISKLLFQKLMPCKNLKYVNVNGTLISATDCAKLRQLKPGCEVVF